MRVEEDGESPTVVLGSLAHGPRRNNPAGRLPVRLVSAIMLGAALICAVLLAVTSVLRRSERRSLNRQRVRPIETAKPSRKSPYSGRNADQSPARPRYARGHRENEWAASKRREVDVAAKYPGRLATLTVNEGDEVTAGQVVAHDLVAGNRSPAARCAGPGAES